jgi:hypothetical protein
MTIIENRYCGPDAFVPLYRHMDGYPAEAGASLLEVLKSAYDAEGVVSGLLALRYEGPGYIPSDMPEPIYRASTWLPEDQADLEYVYEVRRTADSWTVKVYTRGRWTEGEVKYRDWPAGTHSMTTLAELVNSERRQTNARIKARGADCAPYSMLEVPA